MFVEFYWYNPELNEFYGPSLISHEEICSSNKEISKIADHLLDQAIAEDNYSEIRSLSFLLQDSGWVRLYFNHEKEELGISCYKNKIALKTLRAFIKHYPLEFKSLFLEIKEIGFLQGLESNSIKKYIQSGKIEQV